MQNWKIKRMSIKRINQWLSAIGKLLKNYEGKVKLDYCPLCLIANENKQTVGDRCWLCPWKIIEGIKCEELAQELYGYWWAGKCRGNLQYKKWRILRLRQLKNWKIIFKLELARRFE